MALREQPITTPDKAWPFESRKQMMRDIVRLLAERSALDLKNAAAIGRTYGVSEACVTAEMMKHLSESEGK